MKEPDVLLLRLAAVVTRNAPQMDKLIFLLLAASLLVLCCLYCEIVAFMSHCQSNKRFFAAHTLISYYFNRTIQKR